MSVRAAVVEQLRRYDDEAWIALANRGILRRATKDLATIPPRVVAEAETVDVAVADRTVRFTAAGPAHATCSCPSGNVCQHIVAAGIWLAREADAEPADLGDTLHTELLAVDQDALVALAGTAGYRWAWQYVADLDLEQEVRIRAGHQVTIGLSAPRVTFRYMGGGPESLVADQRLPSPERYRVAAVLAYQRVHGVTGEPPIRVGSPGGSRSELVREESRSRLRAAATGLLTDAVRVGLSHLSPGIQERLTTLAVGAHGAAYHRLALLLRRLADQVSLLLERSARGDERRLLDDVALTYALLTALDVAAARGAAPPQLVGRARQRYDAVRSLELVGLGGVPWRTGSGYQGVTAVFWDPRNGTFLTWADARPSTVRGFDPRQRWREPGPWPGLDSPAGTVGRRIVLTGPQVSADGRISGSESASAVVSDLEVPELSRLLPAQESWSALAQVHDPRRRSLLDPPDPGAMWAVLRPERYGTPTFDAVRQTLLWPLYDAAGDELPCEVPYAPATAHLLDRIESLDPPAGTLLLVRLRASRGTLVAEPVSLVGSGGTGRPVDCLHLDLAPTPSPPSRSVPARHPAVTDAEPVALPRRLVELRAFLESQAERGVHGRTAEAFRTELTGHHRRCADIGLTVFGPPGREVDAADQLLRSHYLVQQVSLALTGAAEPTGQ